jgi:glutathione S-transferase
MQLTTYLDDAYPEPPMRPRDALARTKMRLWMQSSTPDSITPATISIAIAFGHQMEAQGDAQFKNRPNPGETEYYKSLAREKLESSLPRGDSVLR